MNTQDMLDKIEVRLFGQTTIQRHGRTLHDLPTKAMELLCYLLIHRNRPHTREALAEVLWPEAPVAGSKKYLRQTLWQLQTAIEQTHSQDAPCSPLTLTPGWVGINTAARWPSDVEAFETAFTLCRDSAGHELPDQQAQLLEAAVDLYRGDLMETWYQDWCIFERDRLQLMYLAMLEKLMDYCEAHQLFLKGLTFGERVLAYDAARECTHRQLMRLHYLAGDRTGALHQYEQCVAALAKEFDVKSSRETTLLYARIREGRLDDAADPVPAAPLRNDVVLDLTKRLDQMQASLSLFQRQVQAELAALSQALQAGPKTRQQTPRQTP